MMKRHLSIGISLFSLFSVIGCESSPPAAMSYPSPNFDAPHVTAAPVPLPQVASVYAPPRAATPVPHITLPPRQAPVVRPMSGIPLAWVPPVAARPWRWIVVHHSDTVTGGAAAFDKMHREKGWDELGYDFVIGNGSDTGDGQVEVGPRWTKQKIGAHAKTPDNRFNEYGIGICMVGNFMVERPTPAQMRALDHLCAYLMVTYHISPENVLGHRDTKATECPGRYVSLPLIRQQCAQLAGLGLVPLKTTAMNQEMLTDVSMSN